MTTLSALTYKSAVSRYVDTFDPLRSRNRDPNPHDSSNLKCPSDWLGAERRFCGHEVYGKRRRAVAKPTFAKPSPPNRPVTSSYGLSPTSKPTTV